MNVYWQSRKVIAQVKTKGEESTGCLLLDLDCLWEFAIFKHSSCEPF